MAVDESTEEYVKVEIRLEADDDKENVETLWAVRVGKNRYRVDNVPFLAYRISCGDIVEARPQQKTELLLFQRVVKKGGHRTIRVILDKPPGKSKTSERILERLVELKCSWEGANDHYFAVDLPPEAKLDDVADYLSDTGVEWEYADPKYEDLFPDEQ